MKDTKLVSFLNFLVAIGINYCFLLFFYTLLWYEFSILTVMEISVASSVLVWALVWLIIKSKKHLLRVSLITLAVLLVVSVIFMERAALVIENIKAFFYWFSQYIYGFENSNYLYELISLAIISAAIAFPAIIFIVKKPMLLFVLLSVTAFFSFPWDISGSPHYNLLYIILYICLLLFIVNCVFIKRAASYTDKTTGTAQFSVWAVLACIVLFAVAWLIPAGTKPIEVPMLSKAVNSISNFGQVNRFSSFSYGQRGAFNNRLGGSIYFDDTHVLDVISDEPVYLYGAMYDTYTGSNWSISDKKLYEFTENNTLSDDIIEMNLFFESLEDEYVLMSKDFLKQIIDLYQFDRTKNQDLYIFSPDGDITYFIDRDNLMVLENADLFDKVGVQINFINLETKTLFLPYKSENLKMNAKTEELRINQEGAMFLNKYHTNGFSYSMDTYKPKVYLSEFANLIRKSTPEFYDNAEITEENEQYINYAKLRSDNIYKKYTQLPEDIPPRVKQLAEKITENYNNNYDKAKAIEEYLASMYTYSLEVGSVPRNADFVDYFLFESKTGYCTYYSSAMAIMLRSIGIPARYSEGYVLTTPSKDNKQLYPVSNLNAHAWTDVYFDGFGWLQFEPTSSFNSALTQSYTASGSYSGSYYESYDEYDYWYDMYSRRFRQDEYTEYDFEPTETTAEETKPITVTIIIISTGITIALIFILVIVANIIRGSLVLFKAKKLDNNSSIKFLYSKLIFLIKTYYYKPNEAETPNMFAKRISGKLPIHDENILKFTAIFEKARYSSFQCSNEEKDYIIKSFANIFGYIKKDIGFFKHITNSYILGKI